MYTTNIAQVIHSNKVFTTGLRLYELLKLAVKPSVYKNDNSREYLPYIVNAASKGYTVIDIGSHRRGYIFDILKVAKLPGRLVVMETGDGFQGYFKKMKQLLNLEHVIIDQLPVPVKEKPRHRPTAVSKKNATAGASIINFSDKLNKEPDAPSKDTIDYYCATNFVIPALVKFKIEKNELQLLQGAQETMRKYKPQILLETTERMVSRETLQAAFHFFSELNYTGYFILDTIRVPLANFDFNTYQNEVLGFYCNNFLFE